MKIKTYEEFENKRAIEMAKALKKGRKNHISTMKLTLVVKNFGNIEDIELNLNRIIVLTGDNDSGALTLLKTIEFVRKIYRRKLKSLEEALKDMKAIGEVEDIGKNIDVEISHDCGDDRGLIGRALKENIDAYLKEDSLIKFSINDKTVIEIDYNKTILRKLGKKDINKCKFFIYPETNLFPLNQIDVSCTIGEYSNNKKDSVVYTHSPYILTSLNNLIYAGILYVNDKVDKADLEDIVPPRFIIEKGIVSAYHVQYGKLINMIDDESGLIVADKIDKASVLIADEFDELLALDK